MEDIVKEDEVTLQDRGIMIRFNPSTKICSNVKLKGRIIHRTPEGRETYQPRNMIAKVVLYEEHGLEIHWTDPDQSGNDPFWVTCCFLNWVAILTGRDIPSDVPKNVKPSNKIYRFDSPTNLPFWVEISY